MIRYLIATSLLLSMAGCSTIPYGVFDGERISRVDPDTYDLVIVAVDGQMDTDGRKMKNLKPGFHLLQVASTKPGQRGDLTFQALPLTVKPCTRYHFVAQHNNRLSNDNWDVVLAGENAIPGCTEIIAK